MGSNNKKVKTYRGSSNRRKRRRTNTKLKSEAAAASPEELQRRQRARGREEQLVQSTQLLDIWTLYLYAMKAPITR
jgi:hypothetical protein